MRACRARRRDHDDKVDTAETDSAASSETSSTLILRAFLQIVPHAFGERPVLKLMYAAVIRAADRWRGITVSEFEQRQTAGDPRGAQSRSRRPRRADTDAEAGGCAQTTELSSARSSRFRRLGFKIDDRLGGRYSLSPRANCLPHHRVRRRLAYPAAFGLDRESRSVL
jgi:hypothetical protein